MSAQTQTSQTAKAQEIARLQMELLETKALLLQMKLAQLSETTQTVEVVVEKPKVVKTTTKVKTVVEPKTISKEEFIDFEAQKGSHRGARRPLPVPKAIKEETKTIKVEVKEPKAPPPIWSGLVKATRRITLKDSPTKEVKEVKAVKEYVFKRYQMCNYGEACNNRGKPEEGGCLYAHSIDALHDKAELRYRTKMCAHMEKCTNADCQFAHNRQQLRPPKCMYDRYCRNEKCTLYHSNEPLPHPDALYMRASALEKAEQDLRVKEKREAIAKAKMAK